MTCCKVFFGEGWIDDLEVKLNYVQTQPNYFVLLILICGVENSKSTGKFRTPAVPCAPGQPKMERQYTIIQLTEGYPRSGTS